MEYESCLELRARREALAAAVNARDTHAIRAILHPTFTSRSTSGPAWTYDQMMGALAQLRNRPEFGERVEIEEILVDGDRAKLTTLLHDSDKWFWFLTKRDTHRQTESWERVGGEWRLMSEQTLDRTDALQVG